MKFYNTLGRRKEEFVPISAKQNGEGTVGIYSCGPTVYWNQHIGNMYAYTVWDILVRFFRYVGYEVKWVMNITDVGHLTSNADTGEDKMEKGAKREGLTVWEIAKKYEKQFLESLDLLNIIRPNVICPATEHIPEQIELIKKIEKNGMAYIISDGVYFDTARFSDYAKFANLKLDEIKDTGRSEISKEKRNLSDFALWKFSPSTSSGHKRQMEWDSPWGVGFPGWHIECTAMSTKHLGEEFDIHTGGIDHIPIHHTNEIAQAYGAFGHQTARFWLHNAFLNLKEGKMSKSEGSILTVQDLVAKGFDPLAFRYLVMSSHYRKGLSFDFEALKGAQVALNKLRAEVIGRKGRANKDYKKEFIEKISEDLAMPEGMAVVWKVVKSDLNKADKLATLLDFDKVLGLRLAPLSGVKEEIPENIKKLSEERQKAREKSDWLESDRLREEIKKEGYVVEDLETGCKIRKAMVS